MRQLTVNGDFLRKRKNSEKEKYTERKNHTHACNTFWHWQAVHIHYIVSFRTGAYLKTRAMFLIHYDKTLRGSLVPHTSE